MKFIERGPNDMEFARKDLNTLKTKQRDRDISMKRHRVIRGWPLKATQLSVRTLNVVLGIKGKGKIRYGND